MKLFFGFLFAFAAVPAFASCDYYWTGQGYVLRCEEPSQIPTGGNCHFETNSTTGQTYWVCN